MIRTPLRSADRTEPHLRFAVRWGCCLEIPEQIKTCQQRSIQKPTAAVSEQVRKKWTIEKTDLLW